MSVKKIDIDYIESVREEMNRFNSEVINLDEFDIKYLRAKFISKFCGIDTIIRSDERPSEYLFAYIGNILYVIDEMNLYDSCAFVLNPISGIEISKTIQFPRDAEAINGHKGNFLISRLYVLFDDELCQNSAPEIIIHSKIKDVKIVDRVNAKCKYIVDEDNKFFSSVDGTLYNKDQTTLIHGDNK